VGRDARARARVYGAAVTDERCSRRCIGPVARRSRGEANGNGGSRVAGRWRREGNGGTGSRPTGSFFVADDRSSRSRSPPISSFLGRIPPLLAPRFPSRPFWFLAAGFFVTRSALSRALVSSAAPSYRDHVRSLSF